MIASNTPDVPGTEREEGGYSLASPNGEPASGHQNDGAVSGTAIEEDWASMATGDPAFWLKD